VLVGWTSEIGSLGVAPVLLYLGTVLWVIGYDTIYALQDIEDDAMVGIKSTARLFGARVKPAVAAFYTAALGCWLLAGWLAGGGFVLAAALLAPAAIVGWQVTTLDRASPANALARFKANHWVGLALSLAFLAEYLI
jgi:4-hydroxybenzoate polyprenyltransferase